MRTLLHGWVSRFGIAFAGFIVAMTGLSLYQAYSFWKSPPPTVAEDTSQAVFSVSLTLTAAIIFLVGMYLARNVYLWSVNREQATD